MTNERDVKVIPLSDSEYPDQLRTLEDPPPVLYVKGEWPLKSDKMIAIVGTRICTIYGKEMAETFGAGCASVGYTVVSGLARGIDTAAHRGALKTGKTIAVLGCGLAQVYPPENKNLADQMTLISELPMDAPPHKHHFPRRNRLVVALVKGVCLIEAPIKSGAMITMEMAMSQNKTCFALPGRADVETFRGNHFLIKSGKAKLVENWQEMVSLLEPGEVTGSRKSIQTSLFELDEEEKKLLACFSSEEVSIEELALKAKFPMPKLNALLVALLLKQAIKELPGKQYKVVDA